jgi:hypothetical protein
MPCFSAFPTVYVFLPRLRTHPCLSGLRAWWFLGSILAVTRRSKWIGLMQVEQLLDAK